ncbi:MAG: GNAT family N-acetyltransferase [Oscillospiraceae bacterium]|nr:GNAT family N-acetyltransferase [Oscillospiraceae bacterium]
MIITKAGKSDLKTILELQYAAYQSEAELLNDFTIPPLKQTYNEIKQEYTKGIFLKATEKDRNGNERIIGSVRAHKDIKNDTVFIGKLIVHPEKQKNGIGTKLLSKIEKECPATRYELFTSSKSMKNIMFYEQLGYLRFRERKISPNLTLIYLEKYEHIL